MAAPVDSQRGGERDGCGRIVRWPQRGAHRHPARGGRSLPVMPLDAHQLREFDAMLYTVAKEYCHEIPDCSACPLEPFLDERGARSQRPSPPDTPPAR